MNLLVCREQEEEVLERHRRYFWDEPYLYKHCTDGVYRRCVADEEIPGILFHCHSSSYAGHFATYKTVSKRYKLATGGPPCSEMHTDSCLSVMYARDRGTSVRETRCHRTSFWKNRGGDGYSRRREEIARGKRPVVEPDDDFVEDSTMQGAPFPETRETTSPRTLSEIEMLRLRTLLDMKFAGTRYADRDTADAPHRRGRRRDVHQPRDRSTHVPAARGLTGRRLAFSLPHSQRSLRRRQVHMTAATATSHSGPLDGGTTSHTEIDRALSTAGQPSQPRRRPRRDVRSLGDDRVWGVLLLKCEVLSHQEPADPLLPQGDRQHALLPTGHRERHRDGDGHDRRGTHRHPVETDQRDPAQRQQITRRHHARACSQLRSYQDWASRNRASGTSAHCGWAAWSHLFYAPSASHLTERRRSHHPRLDIEYLRNSVFLQKTSDASRLLYQFTHVQLGASRMLLPSPSWTTIRGGSNVEFNPPQSALYTGDRPTARDYATPQATTHRGDPPHELDTRRRTSSTTSLRQLRHHRQTDAGLKAAHQHIAFFSGGTRRKTRSPASSRAR
ncbi:unnamed protein product [Microthlaspi erraticum]|uniref:Arabidopsis retrotransposon Orf1 C-terminal domain-containing protein n=1 Tax=Microthlaspi erraticum TaxID=1685480 RepID=A0A6D2K8P6_9BRAS|nr:unnamed protein product [Microthlaspi erraticum]